MFSTSILDVAVGVVFTFLAVSVAASALTEALASRGAWRQRVLLHGIKMLLNAKVSQAGESYVLGLYNNALISHFGTGQAQSLAQITAMPAYIEPKAFATALIALVRAPHDADLPVGQAIAAIDDPQIKSALTMLNARAEGSLTRLHDEVATWFSAAMDRLSGYYKRRTQRWNFAIAFAVALALNADALRITHTIWNRTVSSQALSALSTDHDSLAKCNQDDTDCAQRRMAAMSAMIESGGGLIGWGPGDRALIQAPWDATLAERWASLLFGLLISAGAALFGAPFWFDALQKLVQIRSTGRQPDRAG